MLIVQQINAMLPDHYFELLGVSEGASEEELRAQYKKVIRKIQFIRIYFFKMALVLHPDKNRAPGAEKAFQTLKKAFDVIMSGVDPDAPDTANVRKNLNIFLIFVRSNVLITIAALSFI
jgi:hypothetical protein